MWERENKMLQYLQILLAGHRARMDERGASAVEYALLVGGIAAVLIAAIAAFWGTIQGVFNDTCNDIDAGGNCGP
jgi:pilus assembly protein Flp/PilA